MEDWEFQHSTYINHIHTYIHVIYIYMYIYIYLYTHAYMHSDLSAWISTISFSSHVEEQQWVSWWCRRGKPFGKWCYVMFYSWEVCIPFSSPNPIQWPKTCFFYLWGDHWWRYSGSMVNKKIPWCHEYQKLSRRVCLKIEYHQNKPGLSSLSHHKMGLSQVLDDPMYDMWMLRKKPCTMVRWPALPHCWL